MKINENTLPTDLQKAHLMIVEQQKVIDEIRQQYESLRHQLQCLLRHQYGKKSEQDISLQGLLFGDPVFPEENNTDGDAGNEIEEINYTRKKPRQGQRQFPINILRKRIEYDLTEAQKRCPCGCGVTLSKIGEEVLEQLEKIPEQLYVIEHVRFKYAGCKHEPKIIVAEMPRQPIDKSMAGAGLLADVIIKKYDDHLPLYRQSEIFARHEIDIGRSTLGDWLMQCAVLLKPLTAVMKKVVLSSPKIHTDDTIIPVLEEGKKQTKSGRLWIYLGGGKTAPPCALYAYTETRKQTGPMEFLKGYRGYLQADAYTGYDVLYSKQQKDFEIIEVACMVHARRKFFDVVKTSEKANSAREALGFIQSLYKIESETCEWDDAQRYKKRQEFALPILEKFKEWLDNKINNVLPKSPLGQAISYTLKNWEALNRYCEDGMLAIDNNAAERLMRVVAIGRKNYLFAGSDQGAENAAVFYSLIETAKLNKINPYYYLRDVLKRLPTQLNSKIDELLPWNWKPSEPLN